LLNFSQVGCFQKKSVLIDEHNKELQMNKTTAVKQNSLKIALASVFALGATVLSGSAAAANTASATATATVVTPIAITKATDLAFGSIYPSATAGTVDVNTNGTRSVTGGVSAATGGVTPTAAKFDVTGQGSATYTIAYATGVTLTGPGTAMALTQISDLTGAGGAATLVATGALNAGGTQSIYIGGSLAVGANQVAGAYTGNITATVVYN
jgi:spore coat protein U-like protein